MHPVMHGICFPMFSYIKEDYLFGMTDEINDKEAEERYKELIQKRKEHVPLQYILEHRIYGIYI